MNETDAVIALNGFLISIGLVVAIGPQNVYVLRKGLVGRHVLAVSSACFLSDSALIVIGAAGFGEIVALYPDLEAVMAVLGAGFLFWYGWRSGLMARYSGDFKSSPGIGVSTISSPSPL